MTLSLSHALDVPSPGRPAGRPGGRPGRANTDLIEIIALTAGRFAKHDAGGPGAPEGTGGRVPRRGPVGRWCDGVAAIRDDRSTFADFWRDRNRHTLAMAASGAGPIWVVLGDSTALGLGAPHPWEGYVGQTHPELARHTGRPWRIINLARSGAIARDVLHDQLPRLAGLPVVPDLVTCGVGGNDILQTPPGRLRATLRALIAALPAGAIVLDLPLPVGLWGGAGRLTAPYVAQVNRTIHTAAADRDLAVARISARFTPPWTDKFGLDGFHPSHLGYRDWTRALLAGIVQTRRPHALGSA
jgi:lysophospholipase L1-like esterase